jgi:hypothetical protein
MSKQRIGDLLRLALLEAYHWKCFYTGEPLFWSDVEIDHIIPESKEGNLQELKKELRLDDNFDIHGLENLVPCRHDVNRRKGDSIISNLKLMYYLERAFAKKTTIKKILLKFKKKRSIDQITKSLIGGFMSSGIKLDEFPQVFLRVMKDLYSEEQIKLKVPIEFREMSLGELSQKEGLNNYEDKPLSIFPDSDAGIELVHDNGNKIEVKTLEEWKRYTAEGYYPLTTVAMKLSAIFTRLETLVEILPKVNLPLRSYIKGKTLRELLPEMDNTLLKVCDVEDEIDVTSIGGLIYSGTVKIEEEDDDSVTLLVNDSIRILVKEQFRADITGNGIEDIFCYWGFDAIGGSFGGGGDVILSKSNSNELIHAVSILG